MTMRIGCLMLVKIVLSMFPCRMKMTPISSRPRTWRKEGWWEHPFILRYLGGDLGLWILMWGCWVCC